MKTIMDVDRGPKPAYFAYRNALAPLMTSLRTDRWTFFPGERVNVEAWVCNDRNDAPQDYTLHYQLEKKRAGGVGPQRACRHSPERFPFPGIYRL